MAVVSLNPGTAAVEMSVRAKANVVPQQAAAMPGGLFPMIASAWEIDEYRIKYGWPVPLPSGDIHAPTLVSATGEVIASRPQPGELITNAFLRFIADPDLYDETALRWNPVQGGAPVFTTSVDFAPVMINDYEYRNGDERFVGMNALNFDSDTQNHMWCDFTGVLGGSSGYTVIMVFSPNSVYGNDVTVPYNGLWCPGGPTPAGDTFAEPITGSYVSFTMQGNYLYMETEQQPRKIGISISNGLSNTAPTFLALVVQRPVTTLYAGVGPSQIQVKSLPGGPAPVPLDGHIVLGRSTGDILHTADMALFDLGLYANALSAEEVRTEFQILSKAYGGDS